MRRARARRNEKVRYGVSGSIWTILLVCWPSVHMLESTLGSELFCTSIWRVLMEVGRRLRAPFAGFHIEPLNQIGAHICAPRVLDVVEPNIVRARIRDR